MSEGPSQRASELAVELRTLVGQLKRKLREQAGAGELTSSQTSVLALLEREGAATITTLARRESMRSQSMGALIATLEAAKLVTGAPDPNDGRQTLWSLTPASRALVRDRRVARQTWLAGALHSKFSPQEQARLADAITLLKRLVE